MADYYTQVSTLIDCVSPEGAQFIIASLDAQEQPDDVEDSEWDDMLEFSACLANIEGADTRVWIRDDAGDIWLDRVLDTIANYQKKFKDPKPFALEWSNSCSKPRTDAFGGGAAVVYRGRITFMNTTAWVEKRLGQINRAQERRQKQQ